MMAGLLPPDLGQMTSSHLFIYLLYMKLFNMGQFLWSEETICLVALSGSQLIVILYGFCNSSGLYDHLCCPDEIHQCRCSAVVL